MSQSYPPPTTTGKISFSVPGIDTPCETAYTLWGDLTNTTATPLICLHGGPGTGSRYLTPLSLIHQEIGTPVLLYDQIGCGESTHLPHKRGDTEFWSFDLFMSELRNLISHLKINAFDLLGQSWGGMLAVKYALTQPRGLRKLILASVSSSIKLRLEASARQRLELPTNVRETLERCEVEGTTATPEYRTAMMEFSRRHLCRVDPFPKVLLESMAAMQQDDTVNFTLMGPSPFTVEGSLRDFDVRGELAQITEKTVPGGMLVTNGRFDTTQDEVIAPFVFLPKAKVEWVRFAESGHMALLEETEKFLGALQGFLEM
jgi:proline-specific peptidase